MSLMLVGTTAVGENKSGGRLLQLSTPDIDWVPVTNAGNRVVEQYIDLLLGC